MGTVNFKETKTGLSVGFINLSTGNPVSFLWNFGDGNTAVTADVDHIYHHEGFYTVKLTVVFDDASEGELIKVIGVSTAGSPLDAPLETLVKTFLPPNVVFESVSSNINTLIQKWQLFLQPLVDPEIEPVNIYSELHWPPLVNYLIAQLVAYDLIVGGANQYLIGIGNSSGSDSSGSAGEVKMIKTGPAEVEWFQGSETWSEVFKQGGTFEQLNNQICSLSHRLRINLYICKPLSHNTVVPKVYIKPPRTNINLFDTGKL